MNRWPVNISLPHGLALGGVTSWAVQLAQALAADGRPVRLLLHERPQPEVSPPPGVQVVRCPTLRTEDGRRASLRRYRKLLPAIFLPNLLAESFLVTAALALDDARRLRVVAWNHSDNPYDYACLEHYEPLIHRFVPVSLRCRDELRARLPQRRNDIVRLPYGVRIPPPVQRDADPARPIRLVYAGRFEHAGKRVLLYPDLALRLARAGVRFHLRLVGDGPDAGRLQTALRRIEPSLRTAGSRVEVLAPLQPHAMPDVWRWADAVLLNSVREGFNISVAEAMASGCVPVVSRVASGVDDILHDGRNGLIFPTDDLDAMCAHIAAIYRDPAFRRQLAVEARRAAVRLCAYPRYLMRVIALLDQAAAELPRPWPTARPLDMHATIAAPAPDVADRLTALLRDLADAGEEPVAIYGAGRHTLALAHVWATSPARIAGFIDDGFDRPTGRLWGWPVVPLERADRLGAAAVVISSRLHEAEILARCGPRLRDAGLRVIPLYQPEPASPAAARGDRHTPAACRA